MASTKVENPAEQNELLDDAPNAMIKEKESLTSDPQNQSLISLAFVRSGYGGKKPIIARSEAELVYFLMWWTREHSGKSPTGAIRGSRLNVQDYVATKLIFIGTSETILFDRIFINENTIGWVLRAADGSCMLTKPNIGNDWQWSGYTAWLGGNAGFTKTILASTDGKQNKPSKRNENAGLCGLKTVGADSTVLNAASVKKTESPKLPSAIKPEIKDDRYPTTDRRPASFSNDFEVWQSHGNTGVQTPTQSDPDTRKPWPPQHPGTPPPTPQKRSKYQKQPHKVEKRVISRSTRFRSSSLEFSSAAHVSPSHRGRPKGSKNHASSRDMKAKGRDSTAKLLPAPKPPSHHVSITNITPSPITPKSEHSTPRRFTAKTPGASQLMFHFFVSNEDYGAIPKPFIQCATSASFFNEAQSAWYALGSQSKGTRFMGVKVTIEGVMRPIVVLWDNEDGYERMLEAILSQFRTKPGKLNVEVRAIKFGPSP